MYWYNKLHTLMYLESSSYFCCYALREDSPMRRGNWLEERERGGFISPSYRHQLGREEGIPFSEWQRFLVENRKVLLRDCTSATIDVGIMADIQIADFTLSVPPELLRALARACVWLSITFMPGGNDRIRYGGESYYVLASSTPGETQSGLPGSLRRHLTTQGLQPHVWTKSHALLYTREELLAAIPAGAGGMVRLGKYTGSYGFYSLDVPPAMMRALADRDCTLQLHFNTPQRHGRTCRYALSPAMQGADSLSIELRAEHGKGA